MLVSSVQESLRRFSNVLALIFGSKQVNNFTFIDHWQNVLVSGWEHFLGCEQTLQLKSLVQNCR